MVTFLFVTFVSYATIALFPPMRAVQVAVAAGTIYGFAFAAIWRRLRRLDR
jgi:hypothetical protein